MKLLFNFDGQGSKEIKDTLGFTDADIKFDNLKPYIITATDELIKLIGNTIYVSLVSIYESNSSTLSDKEFLNRAQYSILLDATRFYFMDVDLAYTKNGRVNRVEDNQKIAFEWQIERSNRQAERKYYKSLDALINYMDSSVAGWKNTDAFKLTNELVIRTAGQFDEIFHIDGSRLLFLKLCPGIRKAENERVTSRIGAVKFGEIKTKLKNATALSAEENALLIIIREAVAFDALSWSIPRLSAQLFPEGLLLVADTSRLTTAARKSTEKSEAEALSQRFKSDADAAYARIESLLKEQTQVPYIPRETTLPCRNEDDSFVDC